MRPPTLPRLFSLLTAIVFLNLVAGNTDARAQTFSDQQIQIIDHEDYYYDYLDNQNRSAFYFREGANAFALTTHSLGWLEFSGGVLRQNLVLYGGAEASITGGLIEINVVAYNNPTYWSGGTIGGTIFARGSAQFFIFGSQFTIDDLPVPYGPLTAITGTLGGVLNSGETFSVRVAQGQAPPSSNTGAIILVSGIPTPSPAPDYSDQIALFNDGQFHLIDHADFLNLTYGVRVRSPVHPTSVHLAPGALVGGRLEFSGSSVVDMSGGEVSALLPGSFDALLAEHGTFNMSGGQVSGTTRIDRGARMNLDSGIIAGDLEISHGSILHLTDGTVDHDLRCFYEENDAAPGITMSGGYVGENLNVWDDCQFVWQGGTVAGELDGANGQLEVRGSDFAIDGIPVDFGPVAQTTGFLTGRLESGDALSNAFDLNHPSYPGELILAVPEPGTAILQMSGVVGLLILVAGSGRSRIGSRAR